MKAGHTDFPLSWDAQLGAPSDVETLVLNDFRTEPLSHIRVVRLTSKDTWDSIGRISRAHDAQVVACVIPDYLHLKHRIQGHLKRSGAASVSLHPSQIYALPELMRHLPIRGIITTHKHRASCIDTLHTAPYAPSYIQSIASVWDTPATRETGSIPQYNEIHLVPGFPVLTQCTPERHTYHLHPALSATLAEGTLSITDHSDRFADARLPGTFARTPCPCGKAQSYTIL